MTESTGSLSESLGKTINETLGEIFRAKESHQESCRESRNGSYAWLSARLSPRLDFLRGLVGIFFYVHEPNYTITKNEIDRSVSEKIKNKNVKCFK